MANITYVSFLVWNENDHVPMKKRLGWLESLLEINVPLILFVDPTYMAELASLPVGPKTKLLPIQIGELDTVRKIRSVPYLHPPPNRSPEKDTIEFLTLMNSKPELLSMALPYVFTDYVAYIDAGIRKVFKHDSTLKSLETLQVHSIPLVLLPGCHPIRPVEIFPYLWSGINWMFSGGFFIVPVERVDQFLEIHLIMLNEFLKRDTITWEVNVWAGFGEAYKHKIVWYHGPHDDTMITGIPGNYRSFIN